MEKGTFGSQDEFKVLFILNDEAEKDKRIRKILNSFNNAIKDLYDSNLKSKNRFYKYLLAEYKSNVENMNFEAHIQSRLFNYFISKIRN